MLFLCCFIITLRATFLLSCPDYKPKVVVSFQYGTTALMVASYSGHYECVKELIMQGADINYQREV